MPDFVADAAEMLKKLEEEELDTTEEVKPDHRARISEGYVIPFYT